MNDISQPFQFNSSNTEKFPNYPLRLIKEHSKHSFEQKKEQIVSVEMGIKSNKDNDNINVHPQNFKVDNRTKTTKVSHKCCRIKNINKHIFTWKFILIYIALFVATYFFIRSDIEKKQKVARQMEILNNTINEVIDFIISNKNLTIWYIENNERDKFENDTINFMNFTKIRDDFTKIERKW